MSPASFTSPSHICRFKGAASSSAVFVLVQGSQALAKYPLPRPASTVPGHMGELDRRFPMSPFLLLAFFESGSKEISACGMVALKTVALKEHASTGIAGRNRRAGLPPAFAHLPQITPFIYAPPVFAFESRDSLREMRKVESAASENSSSH